MDRSQFENLLRSLVSGSSRRSLLTVLSSGLLAALPLTFAFEEAGAKKNGKRKRRGKKKRKNNQPPPLPPGPVARADATCPGPRESALSFGDTVRLAQTFTAIASGPLGSAQLGIAKSAGSRGEYLLRLSPVDTEGIPTSDVLAAALVENASVPDGESTVTFTFPNPAAVSAGTTYALILTRSGPNNITWLSRGNDCIGQAFGSEDQSAPFALINELDFIYTVFVSS
jgi:hypothetical protein